MFTPNQLSELASVFYHPLGAGQLLNAAGFPYERHPVMGRVSNSSEWWECVNAALPDGMHARVLAKAAKEYPANSVFANRGN